MGTGRQGEALLPPYIGCPWAGMAAHGWCGLAMEWKPDPSLEEQDGLSFSMLPRPFSSFSPDVSGLRLFILLLEGETCHTHFSLTTMPRTVWAGWPWPVACLPPAGFCMACTTAPPSLQTLGRGRGSCCLLPLLSLLPLPSLHPSLTIILSGTWHGRHLPPPPPAWCWGRGREGRGRGCTHTVPGTCMAVANGVCPQTDRGGWELSSPLGWEDTHMPNEKWPGNCLLCMEPGDGPLCLTFHFGEGAGGRKNRQTHGNTCPFTSHIKPPQHQRHLFAAVPLGDALHTCL